MKTKKDRRTIETLTKDVPFEEVLPLIRPMIQSIAYSASHVYGLEKEDLEQELTIKAYTSWQLWAPEGGTKYSTYVYDILVKHKNYLIRSAKSQRRNGGTRPFSLDGIPGGDNGWNDNDSSSVYDFCADEGGIDLDEHVYMLEVREAIEKVFQTQSERAQIALRGVLEGKTQEDVSRETGIVQSQVSYYLSNFRTKLREEFERREFNLNIAATTVKSRKRKSRKNLTYVSAEV